MQSTFPRRTLADLAPLGAAILLTAAAFLLPAAGERAGARFTVDDIKVFATHIAYVGAVNGSTAHE